MQPIIYFATDHAGFALKNELIAFVHDVLGYEVVDCGAIDYDAEDDFTDYVAKAVREVSSAPLHTKAIILGGSGQGEAMLANRFHDVRAVVYYGGPQEIITLSRIHNNANVLSLGARFLSIEEAKKMVTLWLSTEHPPVEKYNRRNDEIEIFSKDTAVPINKNTDIPLTLVPSLPAASFEEVVSLLHLLEGVASAIQIDIVDGKFAPFVSWPFTEQNVLEELKKLSAYSDFAIEIDCMCMNPEAYLDAFVAEGVERVVIHVGTTNTPEVCFEHAKKHGYTIGLGILNTTPLEIVQKYIDSIDFVQVMGIENIGTQGQPFDTKTPNTIATLRSMYPHLEIAVDGAVNKDTIPLLQKAGANRFAPGSAIAKTQDPAASYKQLLEYIVTK